MGTWQKPKWDAGGTRLLWRSSCGCHCMVCKGWDGIRLWVWPGGMLAARLRPSRKGLVTYLDVHLVVGRTMNGSIEPKAHHKDTLVDREPAEGIEWQMGQCPEQLQWPWSSLELWGRHIAHFGLKPHLSHAQSLLPTPFPPKLPRSHLMRSLVPL